MRECMQQFQHWLWKINRDGGAGLALFVAGDDKAGDAALFLPKSFTQQGAPRVVAECKKLLKEVHPKFLANVQSEGFPPPPESRRIRVLASVQGKNACWRWAKRYP